MLAGVEDGRLDLHRTRAANAARDHLLGDPHGGEIDLDALRDARAPEDSGVMASPRASGDTVAMTTVDEEGRAVTLIQSLYAHFGSGLLEPETGIVLHNRGGGFSLEPGHPGCLAPGARPPHTLCPSMVHAGDTVIAFGCQGGRAQPQILAQVAGAVADPSSDLQAGVARGPRRAQRRVGPPRGRRGADRLSTRAVAHPLDPLTPHELAAAVAAVR